MLRKWVSRFPRGLPLRTQLVLLGAGTLLPVMLFATLVVVQLAQEQQRTSLRRLTRASRLMAYAVDRELSGSLRVLEVLAQSDRIAAGDLDAFDAEARRVLKTQPAWMAVVVLSPEGRQLVNTLQPRGSRLPPALELETLRAVIRTGEPAVTPAQFARTGRWGFGVRVPVRHRGVIRYVLTAAISAEGLSGVVSTSLPDQEWTRTVVDHAGVVLARSRSPKEFVGRPATPSFQQHTRSAEEGVYRDVSLDGASVYVGFSRSKFANWTGAVTAPVEAVDAPLRRSVAAVGGVGLLLFLLTTAGAYSFSRRVSGEITAAAAAAAMLADGREPALVTASVAEVDLLSTALGRSAMLLRERERERNEHLAQAEAAQRDAELSNRSKDEFLALLGHELRNPLAPIMNVLHLVELRGELRPKDLDTLLRQSRHLSGLVDDLLDVSRITRGAVELRCESLEICEIVDAALEMVAPLMAKSQHQLQVEVPREDLVVWGDRRRLIQVVSNLLTNAARYTPPGGEISLTVRSMDGLVELTVVDNGRGLDAALLPQIFELFVQGPRAIDRQEGGLGLGLAIVKSMVQLHGGTVAAESPGPGCGSTFRICLPQGGEGNAQRAFPGQCTQ